MNHCWGIDVRYFMDYRDFIVHTPLCTFKRKFELQSVCNDFKFVNISVKPVPIIRGWKREQFDVDVILNRLNFHLKIVSSTFENKAIIRSLKIKIYNSNKQKELATCTNFLQRQKNLHLALNVLRKCSKLFEDRKTVLQVLKDQSPEYLTVTKTEDSGYCIRCFDAKRNFLFFESNWTIGWNFRNHNVFDFVDFMLNNKDKLFNTKVKPIMKNLTFPHNVLNVKLDLWNDIMQNVKMCLETVNPEPDDQSSSDLPSSLPDAVSKKYKKKLLENKDLYLIHPEIVEIVDSDEESCTEVNIEADNDIDLVSTGPGTSSRVMRDYEKQIGSFVARQKMYRQK